ncbi:MAG: type III pantothenate kinase [Candidatus Saganbacteria bacterium]|uniref:Type III pantothenate kinase n=1 Tax=Candidatus Saganbacteria bacterium TaxID=2575572 RepID=A0A833P3E6_UNCSA|nr:MAG: type III pantothenate kinase [Candidatus Saganbacteria bacterium]
MLKFRMLLAIDAGNSSVKFGLFDGKKLKKSWTIKTCNLKSFKPSKDIKNMPAVVSSVVPSADIILKKKLKRVHFVTALAMKKTIRIKVKHLSEIGADRIVNALAAKELFELPAVIIDFGTATTFDVVSKNGEYLGGLIAPGIGLSRDILHKATAKLPLIEIKPPKNIIGRSTVDAMRSGLVFGYAAMVEGVVKRLKKELGNQVKVIATGGFAKMIGKYTALIDIIDMDLTLKGLNLIWRKNYLNS